MAHGLFHSSENLYEQQVATDGLGRTHYEHFKKHYKVEGKEDHHQAKQLLSEARGHFLQSLEVCNSLSESEKQKAPSTLHESCTYP